MKNKRTIVVMEDEPILLKALSLELEGAGFTVFLADNGKEGMAVLKKHKPDVLLLDLLMPVMDGFDVLGQMKKDKTLKDVYVVVLTNLGQEESLQKAKLLGAKDFFIKSATDLSDLVDKINKILR